MKEEKVYLTLQNGQVFEGKRFGAKGDVVGELVFTTGMTGYIETLTDPSYYGQIVIQTFPLIGNYGMILSDRESKKPYLSAYIVREYCEQPSNFRCEGRSTISERSGIPGIYGVDTRELTKTVREAGVMNAVISSRPVSDVAAIGKIHPRRGHELHLPDRIDYKADKAKRKVVCGISAQRKTSQRTRERGCDVMRLRGIRRNRSLR